ncbi:MAG: DUF368 domain-containing protein [Eubacteriales bacterium]|nr:DUF368 domain-containing protein [Eubacteriales bacterium]
MSFIKNMLKGVLMGIGAVAPGVSGGAIAMILGLYEKIIATISGIFKDFFRNLKKNIIFFLPIGIGVAIGVLLFSIILKHLFANYKIQTSYAFAGLIVGTMPALFKRACKKGFSLWLLIPLVMACAAAFSFVFVESSFSGAAESSQIILSFANIMKLMLIGFIVAGSLVIPGISGSVLMIILGVYSMLLDAVSTINIPVLIPMGAGLAIGVLFFSRIMDFLLKRFYGITYFAVTGFLIGSIPEVLSAPPKGSAGAVGILLFITGAAASYLFSRLEKD